MYAVPGGEVVTWEPPPAFARGDRVPQEEGAVGPHRTLCLRGGPVHHRLHTRVSTRQNQVPPATLPPSLGLAAHAPLTPTGCACDTGSSSQQPGRPLCPEPRANLLTSGTYPCCAPQVNIFHLKAAFVQRPQQRCKRSNNLHMLLQGVLCKQSMQ